MASSPSAAAPSFPHAPAEALRRLVLESTGQAPRGIALRRLGGGLADARIYISDTKDANAWRQLEETLLATGQVESLRLKAGELTLRFTSAHLDALATLLRGGLASLCGPGPRGGAEVTLNFLNPNATKPLHVGHLRNIALGKALAACLSSAGYRVLQQTYICDIGRNVCEALAGWEEFHRDQTPEAAGLRPDVFVGRCYADYARTRREAGSSLDPAALEGLELGDRADELIRGWLARDPAVHSRWQLLRQWALTGQERTLQRLGVSFDQRFYESETIAAARSLTEQGLARGLLQRGADGGVYFPTGQAAYARLPLLRNDGFPTEHLRVIALFIAEQAQRPCPARWIVVCGDEWNAAGGAELALAKQLAPGPLADVVEVVAHGMVTIGGSKMKSRDGQALLAEELLDRLEQEPRLIALAQGSEGRVRPAEAAELLVQSFFLTRKPHKAIEFDLDSLFDATHNPAMAVVRAWCEGPLSESPVDDLAARRALILQTHQLRSLLFEPGTDYRPTEIAKFAAGVAAWYWEQPASAALQADTRALLAATIEALGMPALSAAGKA